MDNILKLSLLLTYKNKDKKDLADYLGVSKAAVSRWFNGDRTFPVDRIDEICEKLEVSRSFFDNIGNLVTSYKPAPIGEVSLIAPPISGSVNVIELEQSALASFFINLDDDMRIARQAYMPSLPERAQPYYAMEVSGDSMYPHLKQGDWIYAERLEKDSSVKPQTLYAIAVGGNMLVKWLRLHPDTDTVELISTNPLYPPMRETLSEVRAILRVVAVLKTL